MSEPEVPEAVAERQKKLNIIDHIDYDAEVTTTRDEAIEAIFVESEGVDDTDDDADDEEDSDSETEEPYLYYDDVVVSKDDRESDGSWTDISEASDFDVSEPVPKKDETVAERDEPVPELVGHPLCGEGTGTDVTAKSPPADENVSGVSGAKKPSERKVNRKWGLQKIMVALKENRSVQHAMNLRRAQVKRLTEKGLKRKIAWMSKKELKALRNALDRVDSREDFKAELDDLERLNIPEKGGYFFSVCCAIISAAMYALIFSIFMKQMGYSFPE